MKKPKTTPSQPTGRRHTERMHYLRNVAFLVQLGKCWLCGVQMNLYSFRAPNKKFDPLRCTAGHLKPKSRGGTKDTDNIVAMHDLCNKILGNVDISKWRIFQNAKAERRVY